MKTILAPVDFSAATRRVVVEASALARALDGRIVLLNVTSPIVVVADDAAFVESITEIDDLNAKTAAAQLAVLEEELEREFVSAESIQVTGSPVPMIIEQAQKVSADYIVIGSHGHTAFYDLLVGSTAGGIVKRSPCPVVIVPPAAGCEAKKPLPS